MNKKAKVILIIVLFGIGSAIGIHFSSQREIHLIHGSQILRNQEGEGDYQLKLQAHTDYGEKEMTLKVPQYDAEEEEKEVLQKEKTAVSKEETFFQMLEQEIQRTIREQGDLEHFQLPTSFQGVAVLWEEVREPQELWMLLLTAIAVFTVAYYGDKEEKKKREKKEEGLRTEYIAFVEKLRLYLMAGLSTRNAFLTITQQYALQRKISNGQRELLRELTIACNMLQNGIREEEVYVQWGNRCSERSYRKLSFLLSVNLKRGNQELLKNLQEEIEKNQELQREQTKKQGEEASTKLLFPMVLFLLVVMILVIGPAYNHLGGM